jgi:hypothetical protein
MVVSSELGRVKESSDSIYMRLQEWLARYLLVQRVTVSLITRLSHHVSQEQCCTQLGARITEKIRDLKFCAHKAFEYNNNTPLVIDNSSPPPEAVTGKKISSIARQLELSLM